MKPWLLVFLLVYPCSLRLLAQAPAATGSWSRHLAAAQGLELQGDRVRAEAEFRLAAAEAQRNGSESAAYANVLDRMGVFYDDIGNFAEAERCLSRSLAIWRNLLGTQHVAIARVINRLAALYLETSQVGKAERLDLESWIHLVETNDPQSRDLIPLLENFGTLQSLRGQFPESDRLYQRALDLVTERGASQSAEHAVVLNDLGVACIRSKRYDAAIEPLTAALEIWKQIQGPDGRNTGMTSHSLAIAYEATGRFDEAERLLKHALSIAEKFFGSTSLRTASVLETYARLLRDRKRKPEARRMEARVRQIVEEGGPSLPSRQVIDVTELSLRGR